MMRSTMLTRCGVALTPIFYAIVLVQVATRAGFDLMRHPLSLLSLGSEGWIQVTNFLLSGALAVASAIGLGMRLGRRDGTLPATLVAFFGIGLIVAGLCPPDPLLGFPLGGPTGIPAHMSRHAVLHGVGFFIVFASLIAVSVVFARRFARAGEAGWSRYSLSTAILTLTLIVGGMAVQWLTSLAFFSVGLVAFGWLSAVCAHHIGRPHGGRGFEGE